MTIGCIGAGSWGTTLSVYLASLGQDVLLHTHSQDQRVKLSTVRENAKYLPGVPFPPGVEISNSIASLRHCEMIVIATPTQFVRHTISPLRGTLPEDLVIVNTSKGIERVTLERVSQVIEHELRVDQDLIVALSGPSHAEEVSRMNPAALVAASTSTKSAELVQDTFNSETLRVYTTDDIVGVELGGALKNIIAICAGIADGLGLGDNSKAALLTRGLAELSRLGIAMGARAETFAGLSGLGDLIATCTSKHSRNRYVGEEIGKGKRLDEVLDNMTMVAEGITTTQSVFALGKKLKVELPIVEQVYAVLFDGKGVKEGIADLMGRKTRREIW